MENTYKKTVIIYHKNCPDGSASAAVAYKKFGDDAEYIPCSDRLTLPEYVVSNTDKENTSLYILDFCYPKEVLAELKMEYKSVIVIDHHISSKEDALSLEGSVFSLEHSGASLTYKYFFDDNLPDFIKTIEAIDIHKDGYVELTNISNYINSLDYDVLTYNNIMNDFDKNKLIYEDRGKAIEGYVSLLEKMNSESFDIVDFDGVIMPATNVSFDINTKSRILASMYNIMPPVAMSYRYNEGQWKISLRSNGDFDCAAFAARYGGGGHKGASGLSIKSEEGKIFFKYIKNIRDKEQ